jgi:hypothetical protein
METPQTPTIFESFNARSLDPAQVARTFVPSQHFEDLLKRRHTLIVGPRGSGKTTLLKMLQQPALEAWRHPSAAEYRNTVNFTGVFVPTDISWAVQLGSLGVEALDEATRRLLSVATFTTHTLRSLTMAFENRVERTPVGGDDSRRLAIDPNSEAILSRHIAESWHLKGVFPSFTVLRWALSARLQEIFALASRESVLGNEGRKERLASVDYLHLHFLAASGRAVELFEDQARVPAGKWAFLFDELELAPTWIQEELGRSLRSTDPRFLFKLALNPFTENDSILRAAAIDHSPTGTQPQPAADQDFDQIALWYVGKVKAYEFCTQLWTEMLHERGMPYRSPEKLLGDSYFRTSPGDWREVYRPGSKVAQRFSELARKDLTFAAYLWKKQLDPSKLDELADNRRAAVVRKVAPIVAVREFYRREDVEAETQGSLRSRKTAVLYSGAESLFALTEGNPRWFIGIMERLLDQFSAHKEKKIPAPWQAEQARAAGERFQAMLGTIPVPQDQAGKMFLGVLECVQEIAEFLHEKIVRGPFKSDPPGTFIVDNRIPDDMLASLGRALNAGAIVYVPDGGPMMISSVAAMKGKRFRISYLLAPIYGLPLRLGKTVALSSILDAAIRQDDSMGETHTEEVNSQLSFLDDME